MRKIYSALLVVALLVGLQKTTFAQKKDFTIEDAVLGLGRNLRVENLKQLSWVAGTNSFAQIIKIDGDDMIVFTNAETLVETNVLSFADFKKNAGFTGHTFPAMQWQDASNFRYENASGVYNYNIETGKQSTIITLEKGIELIEKPKPFLGQR